MATIKDVAQRAGVSAATVSRVLNGDGLVNGGTRSRVESAILDLDYRPNRVARNLRRKRSDTIGVVVSDIENPHFTRAVRAIENAAYAQGYRVVLCNTDETLEKQRSYLEVLAAEQVVGVILVPADTNDSTVSQVISSGIPVVAFDRTVADERADAVFADNHQAAVEATEHLLASGRQRIALIAGRTTIQTGAERLKGYLEVMERLDLPPVIGYGEFRAESARVELARILAEQPDIDGVVVSNNLMAIGALHTLREASRKVPDDVAIVGIDDPPWSDLIAPAMTTLGQPTQHMAKRAFELLIDRVTGTRTSARFEVFQFQLRVRESCGATMARTRASDAKGV